MAALAASWLLGVGFGQQVAASGCRSGLVCSFVVLQWNKRKVTARTPIDLARLDAKHVGHLTMMAAMKAFRKASGATSQTQPSKRKGSRRESHPKSKALSKASSASSTAAPLPGGGDDGLAKQKMSAPRRKRKVMSDSESSTTPQCSCDGSDDGSEANGSQASWDGKGIGSALGPPEAKAKANDATKGKGAKPVRVAPGEQIIEYWGGDRFPFARIMPKGVLTGYGAYCARHTNSDGYAAKTHCKKAITLGNPPMTEDEARLRLKRWIIAGSVHNLEPKTRERQAHIDMGGKRLDDFGSDGTWGDWGNEDLDVLLDALE